MLTECIFFRDDDWGAQYSFVPSNTLLEPNNVIPSWEFGDEENKEVSGTLRRIRQKYDNIHKTVLAKEKELETKKVSLTETIDLTGEFRENLSKPSGTSPQLRIEKTPRHLVLRTLSLASRRSRRITTRSS